MAYIRTVLIDITFLCNQSYIASVEIDVTVAADDTLIASGVVINASV